MVHLLAESVEHAKTQCHPQKPAGAATLSLSTIGWNGSSGFA
jgi:hypothetical protein